MTNFDPDRYVPWALEVSLAAAAVANYCDHVEHNEDVERGWIWDAGRTLRRIACEIAAYEDLDLLGLYAERLRMIERRNPLYEEDGLDGGLRASEAATWRELQLAQVDHDRHYHPDVMGLNKFDQLSHYALHLAKLAGTLAEVARGEGDAAFLERRLPDFLLFGVKLATVSGKTLPDKALASPSADSQRQLMAA